LQEYELAVAEIRAVNAQKSQQDSVLADELVQELLQLSKELGELKQVKLQHEQLLVQYDEVVAKLLQAEDNLADESERRERLERTRAEEKVQAEETAFMDDSKKPAAAAVTTPELGPQTTTTGTSDVASLLVEAKAASVSSSASVGSLTLPQLPPAAAVVEEEEQQLEEQKPAAVPDVPKEVGGETVVGIPPAPAAAPASESESNVIPDDISTELVALMEDEDDDEPPRLDELETKVLMEIFAFLDALDILNMAQINISMYSRVDSLFGAGAEATDNSTIASTESPTPAAAPQPPAPASAPAPTIASVIPAATSVKTATTASTSTASHPQPTMVTLPPSTSTSASASKPMTVPPRSKTPPPSSKQPAHAATKSVDSTTGLGIFSSLLQPRNRGASQPSTPTRAYQRSNTAPATEKAQPLSAAMANSMAAKLSDAELNAIILMTERLKQKEAQTAKLTKENAELVAKLDGTEGVKQFLIAKVRDMESSMTLTVENEIKVAQQIASDQEVIAFLDTRVQELEREARLLREEKQSAETELTRVQQQSAQKATVMGDMLQFEREKLKDGEREWKATKKLLVKEVKSCRSQIVALQAERDGYREQNETLHKAVVHSPNNSYSRADSSQAFT